jgi:hypothetical protein
MHQFNTNAPVLPVLDIPFAEHTGDDFRLRDHIRRGGKEHTEESNRFHIQACFVLSGGKLPAIFTVSKLMVMARTRRRTMYSVSSVMPLRLPLLIIVRLAVFHPPCQNFEQDCLVLCASHFL